MVASILSSCVYAESMSFSSLLILQRFHWTYELVVGIVVAAADVVVDDVGAVAVR